MQDDITDLTAPPASSTPDEKETATQPAAAPKENATPSPAAQTPEHRQASVPGDNSEQPNLAQEPASTSSEPEQPACADGELDLSVIDAEGNAISNLLIRLVDRDSQQILHEGRTNAKGHLPAVKLKIGTIFLVHVGTDAGNLKHVGVTGKIESPGKNWCSLASPRTRFEFSTYSHRGAPGTAEAKKQATILSHNQTPEATPNVSRNPEKPPQSIVDRDKAGNPKVIVKDGLPNMYGQHNNDPAPPNVSKADLEKVQILMDFAKKQVGWAHAQKDTTETIIKRMKAGTYQPAGSRDGFGSDKSLHSCNKYVKIALWYAGYSHNNGDLSGGVSPAKEMGPCLEAAGFKNVTNTLPDARWASPGDVIVYKKIGAPAHVGHIDIRTYDGYVSDFFETYLPVTGFEVIGIYRKYYDPLPEKRMKAFLKVLRSREATTVLAKYGDAATYRALPLGDKRGLMFENFETHPFENVHAKNTASGAYGITCGTWHEVLDRQKLVSKETQNQRFSPQIQDRIVVTLMESSPSRNYARNNGITALTYIRQGKPEQAIQLLKGIWSCLPGANESRGFTTSQFLTCYENYLSQT